MKIPPITTQIKTNALSSMVVFFVAVPLCLSIALASGAPLMAGLISGIVGGIIVGGLSGSALGVSGPAAGLVVIVYTAIEQLGSYEAFLTAVVLAGILQWGMGRIKAGVIGHFFPSSVICGMLSGIGITIFIKQIPQALGYPASFINSENLSFVEHLAEHPFAFIQGSHHISVMIITLVSLAVLLLWNTQKIQQYRALKLIPASLLAVVAGVLLNQFFAQFPQWALTPESLVALPEFDSIDTWLANFALPDVQALSNYHTYTTALVIALVASLETLLSLEAIDKLDPKHRESPANRELKAQGIGNIIAGCIGGLPITQVIVRSSANMQSGAQGKTSAILHGTWLLLSIVLIPSLLNHIPLATLAAILLVIAFKLANLELFKTLYHRGWEQFVPFIVTICGMLMADLLIGVSLGLIASLGIVLRNHSQMSHYCHFSNTDHPSTFHMRLSEEMTFLNKSALQQTLKRIPADSQVIIDASRNLLMDYDVKEIIDQFAAKSPTRGIAVTLVGFATQSHTTESDHFPAAEHLHS